MTKKGRSLIFTYIVHIDHSPPPPLPISPPGRLIFFSLLYKLRRAWRVYSPKRFFSTFTLNLIFFFLTPIFLSRWFLPWRSTPPPISPMTRSPDWRASSSVRSSWIKSILKAGVYIYHIYIWRSSSENSRILFNTNDKKIYKKKLFLALWEII